MDVIARTTEAVRRADHIFESEGGSSRHYVRDCLLPMLAECGLEVRLSTDQGAVEERDRWRALAEAALDAVPSDHPDLGLWLVERAALGGQ